MCRFVSWIGEERYLEDLVLAPEHSLIHQSKHALICKTPVNADGFGLAWYDNREEPCVYKDTHPAWADPNLKQIAYQTKVKLFLAHVRASTGMAISRNNCHPFHVNTWSFMHNGQVGGHDKIRKELDQLVSDHYYQHRYGATDSEAIFLIALENNLETRPILAMAEAVQTVEMLSRRNGTTPHMRFSACWSDGTKIYAARYASDNLAPSLCYKKTKKGVIIASEPLDNSSEGWVNVNFNEAIIVSKENIEHKSFLK